MLENNSVGKERVTRDGHVGCQANERALVPRRTGHNSFAPGAVERLCAKPG